MVIFGAIFGLFFINLRERPPSFLLSIIIVDLSSLLVHGVTALTLSVPEVDGCGVRGAALCVPEVDGCGLRGAAVCVPEVDGCGLRGAGVPEVDGCGVRGADGSCASAPPSSSNADKISRSTFFSSSFPEKAKSRHH